MTTPTLSRQVRGKGRHYEHPETGELLISVTNVLSALSKPALPRWSAKVVAETAYRMRHALTEMEEADAIDTLKGAPWRSSSRAASRGDAVHELLERLTLGQQGAPLTGEAAQYEDSVARFLDEHELEPWHTEVTVFGDGYAGTADFLGVFDGKVVIMDYKTGTKGLYPEVALQATALRYADSMVVDGKVVPMPDTQEGVAVLIRPDGYEVARVENPFECFSAFKALLRVRRWQLADDKVLGPWEVDA